MKQSEIFEHSYAVERDNRDVHLLCTTVRCPSFFYLVLEFYSLPFLSLRIHKNTLLILISIKSFTDLRLTLQCLPAYQYSTLFILWRDFYFCRRSTKCLQFNQVNECVPYLQGIDYQTIMIAHARCLILRTKKNTFSSKYVCCRCTLSPTAKNHSTNWWLTKAMSYSVFAQHKRQKCKEFFIKDFSPDILEPNVAKLFCMPDYTHVRCYELILYDNRRDYMDYDCPLLMVSLRVMLSYGARAICMEAVFITIIVCTF